MRTATLTAILLISMCLLWGAWSPCFSQSNPVPKLQSIYSRRVELDRSHWIYNRWLRQLQPVNSEEPEKHVYDVMRERVSTEQYQLLSSAFDKRHRRNNELLVAMLPHEILERRALLEAKGHSPQAVDRFAKLPEQFSPPSFEDSLQALVDYQRKQDEAEADWVETIDEILSPTEMDLLASHIFKSGEYSYLATKFASHLLNYDKTQEVQMPRLCSAARAAVAEIVSEVHKPGSTTTPGADVVAKFQKQRRIYFLPYSILSARQFHLLATITGLKQEGETWPQMKERVRQKDQAYRDIMLPLIEAVLAEIPGTSG